MPDAKPASRFVILAVPRSGSNMLCTLLNSHPDILCHHELFNPKGIRYALNLRDTDFSLGSIEEREQDPLQFLEMAWLRSEGHASLGFKFTHRQNETVYLNLLEDQGCKKILLSRRNQVRTWVSWLLALKLRQWEVYSRESLIQDRPKVTVSPEWLLMRARYNQLYLAEIRQLLAESGQTALELEYETLLEIGTQDMVLDFLGVDSTHQRLSVGTVIQNPGGLETMVENYEALKAGLKGTFLEQDLFA